MKWNEVTWYSRWGAIILFLIVLPALSFYMGTRYEQTMEVLTIASSHHVSSSPLNVTTSTDTLEREVVIYIPKDLKDYENKVTTYMSQSHVDQGNGEPYDNRKITEVIPAIDFIAQKIKIHIPPGIDVRQATVDAALATVQSQTTIKTIYFSVENGTAYVVLNIDVDGWAGVSYSIYKAQPIVYQTLLQFPEIKNVVFGTESYNKWKQAGGHI